jgi:hypothetical protein
MPCLLNPGHSEPVPIRTSYLSAVGCNRLGIYPRGSRTDGREVNVVIEYDGPRLDDSRGPKLDERAPGYGFGLPITRELAELCRGAEFV